MNNRLFFLQVWSRLEFDLAHILFPWLRPICLYDHCRPFWREFNLTKSYPFNLHFVSPFSKYKRHEKATFKLYQDRLRSSADVDNVALFATGKWRPETFLRWRVFDNTKHDNYDCSSLYFVDVIMLLIVLLCWQIDSRQYGDNNVTLLEVERL